MKKIILMLVLSILFIFQGPMVQAANMNILKEGVVKDPEKINIYFFWGEGCSHCAAQKPYLEELDKSSSKIDVHYYEVFNNRKNGDFFQKISKEFGTTAKSVPATFVGEKYWVGYDPNSTMQEIKEYIDSFGYETYVDKGFNVMKSTIKEDVTPSKPIANDDVKKTFSIFESEISVEGMPLVVSTFIIGFLDGLNPCSLWVLTFLLGMVAITKDRKKVLIIGFTYLGVAGITYGLSILGILNAFSYISHLRSIIVAVAIISALWGLVNIKDFFFFKKGISFTIPDKYKPKIYSKARNLIKADSSIKSLILGSAVMALGITLIELPCTAGLPILWSNIVVSQNIQEGLFLSLLGIYILAYSLLSIIIFLIVIFTMKISKITESQGRLLKLIGGLVMLSLSVILFFGMNLLNNIPGTIGLFLGIVIFSIITAKIYDKYVIDRDGKDK